MIFASEPSYAELREPDLDPTDAIPGVLLTPADINCDYYPNVAGRYMYAGDDLGLIGSKRVGLIQRIVSCVRDKIEVVSYASFDTIRTMMVGIVFKGMVIYLSFFIIKVMLGGYGGAQQKMLWLLF